MIFAEVNGKLGSDYSGAHERAEDLLTSTTFGLLRYIPIEDGLLALVRNARSIRLSEDHGGCVAVHFDHEWLDLSNVASCDVEFWPAFREGYGEPDVILCLRDTAGTLLHVVLIEVKFHSPKSGTATDEDDAADEEVPDPDQLVKYWHGLIRCNRYPDKATRSLIYLTTHGIPPISELADAFKREPRMRLGWLSWMDVYKIANEARAHVPAADLAQLLRYKGLCPFQGFTAPSFELAIRGALWLRNDREVTMNESRAKQLTNTIRYLMEVRKDADALLASIENEMVKEGWKSTRSAQSSEHPFRSIAALLTRNKELPLKMLVFIDFDPPAPRDEPVCLAVVAAYSPINDQKTNKDIGKRAPAAKLLSTVRTDCIEDVNVSNLPPMMKANAIAARALVLLLREMSDDEEVQQKLIERLVKMVAEVSHNSDPEPLQI